MNRRALKRRWRIAHALLSAYYAEMTTYRAELYLWALSGVMPFLLMGLWMQASAVGDLARTPAGFARYFLAVYLVRQLTVVWVIFEFDEAVVEGKLSPYLLQPLNPLWRYVASHIAERLARLPFLLALVALFFVLYPQALWRPTMLELAAAMLAISMAFALRFIMQYCFAMLAFWTEHANAVDDLWFMGFLFLSGFLAPLEMFPESVRAVALATPFPYMIYLPAKLLIGEPVALIRGLVVMLIWATIFYLLWLILWRRGLRRYCAMGA